jgi:hypothetical protein
MSMVEIKLYDMDSNSWAEAGFQQGDHFRSDIGYKCGICHTKTNDWVIGDEGPQLICPGTENDIHSVLEINVKEDQRLDQRFENFSAGKLGEDLDKLLGYRHYLGRCIDQMRTSFSSLHNLEGDPQRVVEYWSV